jgi:hypothetical protein
MKAILLANYINWLVCPIGITLAPGYEWARDEPKGSQVVVEALDKDGTRFKCVFISDGKPKKKRG